MHFISPYFVKTNKQFNILLLKNQEDRRNLAQLLIREYYLHRIEASRQILLNRVFLVQETEKDPLGLLSKTCKTFLNKSIHLLYRLASFRECRCLEQCLD
jgi:hypothetical protein